VSCDDKRIAIQKQTKRIFNFRQILWQIISQYRSISFRDTERDFNYIPTPNARQVVGQIVNDFKKGIRSFNIVGTYGTGKSSFLLALEQSVKGKKPYFETNFLTNPKVDFVKIVGAYTSIVEQFADTFEVTTNKNKHENILSEIFNRYHSLGKNNGIWFLLLDEFLA
jgi:DNA replication protein DnaC